MQLWSVIEIGKIQKRVAGLVAICILASVGSKENQNVISMINLVTLPRNTEVRYSAVNTLCQRT